MAVGSAAAAPSASRREACALDVRLRRLLARADRAGESRLAARLLPTLSSSGEDRTPRAAAGTPGFYWLRVPEWLAESFGFASRARGAALLDDLCWIQYCVYAVFRVQDDLVDGESADPLLAVEANRLAIEAARCAARWFDGESPFWSLFQGSIDRTSRAIVALRDVQRRPEREPHAELGLYVDLAACLQLAAGGLAIACGREQDWVRRLSPALDRLAVAGQILDDLEDVDEDLADGRINYAAWWLSRPVFGSTREALAAVVAFNLVTGDRLRGLVDVARRQVVEAAEILGPDVCPAVHRFLGLYRREIDSVEAGITSRCAALLEDGREAA